MTSGARFLRTAACLAPVIAVLLLLPSPATSQPGTAPTGDPGGFGIDGDLDPGVPVAGTTDWNSIIMSNGAPTSSATLHGVDAYNSSDLAFTGTSSRLVNDPNTSWLWDNAGMANPLAGKDNFSNGVAHFSRDAGGHHWLTWGVDREGAGTSSYMDVVLFQNTVTRNGNGTFSSTGPHGGHTVGDLVLSLELFPAGEALPPSLAVRRWTQTGPGTYDFTSLTPAAGTTFTATNNGFSTAVPYNAFGNGMYQQDRFAEAAIDLTALLASIQPNATFRTVFFVSRFGPEIGSILRDFIEPIATNIIVAVDAPGGAGGTRIVGIRPNPARGPVRVDLELAREGLVAVEFFDLAGRLVGSVTRGTLPPGRHVVEWQPTRDASRARGGILFARLASGSTTDVRRFVLLR